MLLFLTKTAFQIIEYSAETVLILSLKIVTTTGSYVYYNYINPPNDISKSKDEEYSKRMKRLEQIEKDELERIREIEKLRQELFERLEEIKKD